MSTKSTDVAPKATALESQLQGKRFLGGDKPSAEDVKQFEALLGAGNLGLFRWVKHMASFTAAERNAWGAPVKVAKAPEGAAASAPAPAPKKAAAAPAPKKAAETAAAPSPAPKKDDSDSDVDLFGDETEEETAAKEAKKAADKKAAEDKKAAKKAIIAKSSILMDIKPWEAEQDLEDLAKRLKAIEKDGLLWGAHKLVPVAFGVKKLQIIMVIEDDKISSEDIEDMITGDFEEEVQSMDIVAWNKI